MKALTAKQQKQLKQLTSEVEKLKDELNSAATVYNEVVGGAFARINEILSELNDKIAECNDFREEIVEQMQEFSASRSEKWHESENGEAFQKWMDDWGEDELESAEIAEPEMIEDDCDLPALEWLYTIATEVEG